MIDVFDEGGTDTFEREPYVARFKVRGGGFVFQQVHNILAGVPPQNITAMFDAVRK